MDQLGALNDKVADLEKQIAYEANVFTKRYLKYEKDKLENQIKRITDNDAISAQYAVREKKYRDTTKNLNPAVDIVLRVNINGKEQKPVKDTVFRFNKNGGIEQSTLKHSSDTTLEQTKTDVYTTAARLEKAKTNLLQLQLDTTKSEEQKVREAMQAQSSQLFLQKKLEGLEKNLKTSRRTFSPLFYVPLAKLTPRNSTARSFAEDYMGSGRSITNVEDNLTILFELLFKNRKEITFEGKSYYFVSYKWEKSEFPPYGYQTGRGKIEVRALLKKPTSLKWLLPDFVLRVAKPSVGTIVATATGPLGATATAPLGATATAPSSATATSPSIGVANAAMEEDGVTKTDAKFLEEILEQENIIEAVYNAVRGMAGGGIWEDVTNTVSNAVSFIPDYLSTKANKKMALAATVTKYDVTKGWFQNIDANPSLVKAAHEYKSAFSSTSSIELNNHTTFRIPAALFPTRKVMYAAYMYEYLAYRFSIYHAWFKPDVWSFYSAIPYFISAKKNTTLLRDLMPYAPTLEIRNATVKLVELWNDRERKEEVDQARKQHKTQMMYLKRFQVDLVRRLDLFRAAFNYTMLQIVLKELSKCSAKGRITECITNSQRLLLAGYKGSNYDPTFKQNYDETPTPLSNCDTATTVEIPLLWNSFPDVQVNGVAKPAGTTLTLTKAELRDVTEADYGENFLDATNEIERRINEFKGNNQVKLAVAVQHMLPETVRCLERKAKELQIKKNEKMIAEIHKEWVNQTKVVQTEHASVRAHVEAKQSCFFKIGELTPDEIVACSQNLSETYAKVNTATQKFLMMVRSPHDSAAVNFWAETYADFYSELDVLHKKYKEAFTKYSQVFDKMTQVLESLRISTSSYERVIAQMDYLGEAYEYLTQVTLPMEEVPIYIRPKNSIYDYDKIISNLATLCDILEHKVFRGVVSSSYFPLEPLMYDKDDAGNQSIYFEVVKSYVSDNPVKQAALLNSKPFRLLKERLKEEVDATADAAADATAADAATSGAATSGAAPPTKQELSDSVQTRSLFSRAYAKLDPAYVLYHSKIESIDGTHMLSLFQRAIEHLRNGNFSAAINALYLCLVVPTDVLKNNNGLYSDAIELLGMLLKLTGHNSVLLSTLPPTPSDLGRNQVLIRFLGTTDDSNVSNLIHQEFGGYQTEKKTLAKYIAAKFKDLDSSDRTIHHTSTVNYVCYQFYRGKMSTRDALNYPMMKAVDYAKILRFFPENHVGREIIANIRDAMAHADVQDTYRYVAEHFVIPYQLKKRKVLDEIRLSSESKRLKRDIKGRMEVLGNCMHDLKYVEEGVEAARLEREDKWPKKGAGSTFMRTTEYPYVNGHYTVRVNLNVTLSDKDPTDLSKLSCEAKYLMASKL